MIRRPRSDTLKRIVVMEIVFLVVMWTFFADRIRSSRLWTTTRQSSSTPQPPVAKRDSMRSNRKDERLPGVWAGHDKNAMQQGHYRDEQKERRANVKALIKEGLLKAIPENRKGPVLVIGGSDGSGTRVFADIMRKLAVPMRVQDKETLDIHGGELFLGQGWPPLVNMILNSSHSANYELDDLSNMTLATAKKELLLLKETTYFWQLRLEQKYYTKQRLNLKVNRADNVSIGFKAPVTMLLLPLLKETFGSIKFLHVVRDGRDVSVSTNKSPVQKFYKSMYSDADERLNKYANGSYPILAMHLWNDWNTQVAEWEQKHVNDPDFDYLVMRSEDLIDRSMKFETLARLAAFVGSPRTLQELCCMSLEEDRDMGRSLESSDKTAADYRTSPGRNFFKRAPLRGGTGRVVSDGSKVEDLRSIVYQNVLGSMLGPFHGQEALIGGGGSVAGDGRRLFSFWGNKDRSSKKSGKGIGKRRPPHVDKEPPAKVHSRFGKWREMLKDEPELLAKLHQLGAKGLATFGYEPYKRFMDANTSPVKDFQCDETVECTLKTSSKYAARANLGG